MGLTITPSRLDGLGDTIISSPAADELLKYTGAAWINSPGSSVNSGAGVDFFYDDTSSDISTYQTLNRGPENVSESSLTGVSNNNRVLIKAYASASTGLGGSQIDAGEWIFDVYAKVDVIGAGLSSVDIDVFKRTSGGTETLLFNINSGTISGATELYSVNTVQQAVAINSTDRLVVKVYSKTTAIINRTVTFYYGGSAHYSNLSTPLVTRHNDLAGLQGGQSGEYYHTTSAQNTVVGNTSGVNTGDQTLVGLGGAPSTAAFVTTQSESGLSAEFSLGSLTSGILKHAVVAGVSTPATATAGTDYAAANATLTIAGVSVALGGSMTPAIFPNLGVLANNYTVPDNSSVAFVQSLTLNNNVSITVPSTGALLILGTTGARAFSLSSAVNLDFDVANTGYIPILSKTLPAALAIGDTLIVEAWATILNNSAAARTYSYQFNIGSVALIDAAAVSTILNSSTNRGPIRLKFIVSISSASLWYVYLNHDEQVTGTATIANTFANLQWVCAWNTGTNDLTGNQVISLKAKSSAATTAQTLTLHSYDIRRIPQQLS